MPYRILFSDQSPSVLGILIGEFFEDALLLCDGSLCSGKTCNRNTERRAAYIRKAYLMAELNG